LAVTIKKIFPFHKSLYVSCQ